MVHIPPVVRKTVYAYLFKHNGLAMKDTHRTEDVEGLTYVDSKGQTMGCRNLYVNCLMKSLKSRNYVKDTFTWESHYYMLTKAGEEYLRYELGLDQTVRPEPCTKTLVSRPEEEERRNFSKKE